MATTLVAHEVWSWTIRRKEKEKPLRELRSTLRGTPQAKGTYVLSEVIQKKSETYQRFLSFDSFLTENRP